MLSASFNSEVSIFFSSDIPVLEIASDLGSVDVSVSADGNRAVFKTALFVDGWISFDVKSIIVADMISAAAPAADYVVAISDSSGAQDGISLSISVIFSRGKFDMGAETFAESHFLSLSDSKLLPKINAFDSLSVWSDQTEYGSISISYAKGGQILTHSVNVAATPGITRLDIDFQDLMTSCGAGAIPVSAKVSVGDRIMNYFFSDLHPSSAVSFLNNFLCPEHFWMFGQWKRSGKVSRSAAVSGAENVAAALEVKPEFEISTHPLDFRQAYVIPEIAMSAVVWVYLFAEGSPLAKAAFKATPVSGSAWKALAASSFKAVPTEGSLEVSPADADPTTYTLKVIAAMTEAAIGFNYEIPRIFTQQFKRPFI